MSLRSLTAPILALALTVALGCGGNSSSKVASNPSTSSNNSKPPATTPTKQSTRTNGPAMPHPTGKVLTRTQLIAKADTICARRNTKLAALSISSQREIVGILPVVIAYDNRESRELGKLVPPPSLMHDWEQIVSLANHYSEEIEQVERYAAVQNNSVASSFTRASAATHNRLIAIARHAGFKDCSEVG